MDTTTNYGWPKPAATGEKFLANVVRDFLDLIDAALYAAVGVTAWTAPTFTNSWVNFGSTYQNAQYRKIGDRVFLRGTVKNGTVNTAIFTLPTGFRPPADLDFAVSSGNAYGTVTVSSAGVVAQAAGVNTSVSLNGISFSVTT